MDLLGYGARQLRNWTPTNPNTPGTNYLLQKAQLKLREFEEDPEAFDDFCEEANEFLKSQIGGLIVDAQSLITLAEIFQDLQLSPTSLKDELLQNKDELLQSAPTNERKRTARETLETIHTRETAYWLIFEATKKKVKQRLLENLTREDILSANLYTTNDPKFFYVVNNALRDFVTDNEVQRARAKRILISWKYFIIRLSRATIGLPGHCGKIYRGENSSYGDEETLYRPGTKVTWPCFTSCSTNEKVALKFCGEGAAFFEITLPIEYGCFISMYSEFPDESEVLLPPFTSFKVTEYNKKNGKPYINMICLGLPPFLKFLETPNPTDAASTGDMNFFEYEQIINTQMDALNNSNSTRDFNGNQK